MTQEEIKQQYKTLFLRYSSERDVISLKIRKYGMMRITFFLIWLLAIYFSTTWSWIAFGMVMFLGMLIFTSLVIKHSKLHKRKTILDLLVKINEDEINSIEWNYKDFDAGEEFIDKNHHFTYDLDIFGKGSLFQYINRTSTNIGKQRLAKILSHIIQSQTEITCRQKAIAELTTLFEWRQDFRVEGLMADENPDELPGLEAWVNSKPDFNAIFFRILIYVVPLITLGIFMISLFGVISFWTFLAYLTIPLILAGIKHRRVNAKHALLGRKFNVLKKFSKLFLMIEQQQYSSQRMQEQKATLIKGNHSASRAIRDLARISNAYDVRLNLLGGFMMNVFLMWDIRQSIRLEKWQRKYKDLLPEWFNVLGEVDAYVSLAGYSYNSPDFIFPEIREADDIQLEAKQMGHPLIHIRKRVCNDFSVNGWGNFTILTGANMAGKSTFLRTVGVNMLLASCGAPLCAEAMAITPVMLVTSIHTIDSLADNESYFYAELKRLKMIIDMLKEGKQIFIILDEILKGTNSRDKQSGSRALVEQLVSLDAAGLIATHDLSLGELEARFPEHIRNRCFEVNIKKDQLTYDYLLKDGIAQNMNATILMEKMGITLEG